MNCKLFLSILSIGFLTTTFSHADESVTANIDALSVASKLSDFNRNDLAIASPLGIIVGEDSIDVAMQKYPNLRSSPWALNSAGFSLIPLGYNFSGVTLDPIEHSGMNGVSFLYDSAGIIHQVYITFDPKFISYDKLYTNLSEQYLENPMDLGRLNNSYAYIDRSYEKEWNGFFLKRNMQFVANNLNIDIVSPTYGQIKDSPSMTSSMKKLSGELKIQLHAEPNWIRQPYENNTTISYISPSLTSLRQQQLILVDEIYSNLYQIEEKMTTYLEIRELSTASIASVKSQLQQLATTEYSFLLYDQYHDFLTRFVDAKLTPDSDEATDEFYKSVLDRTNKDLLLSDIIEKYSAQINNVKQSDKTDKDQQIEDISRRFEAELQPLSDEIQAQKDSERRTLL